MTYSVQLWSVRQEFADDPIATLTRLRDIGFTAVEPFDLVSLATDHGSTVDELGLSVPSAHVPMIGHPDIKEAYAAAEALGTRVLIDSGRREGWDDLTTIREYSTQLNRHAAEAAGRGIQVGYHNHWWELAPLGDRTALEAFIDGLDKSVALEVDIYWAAIGGADPGRLLADLGSRVKLIHVKDGIVMPDPPDGSQLPVGRGTVPIGEALRAAPQALRVLEFDEYPGDTYEALASGLSFVRGLDEER